MISIICPTHNEKEYIERIIIFFLNVHPEGAELLILDGGSTDGTIQIVEKYSSVHQQIKLLHNPNKYVPFALNMGIKNSRGDFIIRLDAHTTYADNYFEKILETFQQKDADIVGGPMRTVGKTYFQKAIAFATSTTFGIGDSKIHKLNYSGESDHVYLGAWKRNLFNEIGYFDERLIRNQDDEFHYRAKSFGKKIYLNSEIVSYYFPRSKWNKLFSQYFQYGLFKPLVLRKIKSEIKLRHLIPVAFVIYLIFLASFFNYVLLTPLLVYFFLDIFICINNRLSLKEKLMALTVFPIIHISYGSGFLLGLLRK